MLAQAVRAEHGRIEFDVPGVALRIIRFDEVDRTYFKISSRRRGFIAGETGLPGKAVGRVDIRERHSFVEVATEHARAIVDKLNRAQIKGHKTKVKVA